MVKDLRGGAAGPPSRAPGARHRSQREASAARHGQLRRPSPLLTVTRFLAATLAVLLVSGGSLVAITLAQLDGNIDSVALVGERDKPVEEHELGSFDGGFNLLIVGSDRCDDPNGCPGRDAELNDVTMLLHVYEDQRNAVAVSIPRDLVVPFPSCPREDGPGSYPAMSAVPINNSLSYGGLACTVLTVEELTGLDIPYAGLISFNGVISMSNAIGGVDVCIDGPIIDPLANYLNLPKAGTYTLQGEQALGFLRTRYGVGDGSDLGRISSQQVFLSSLVRKIKDDSTLTDFSKLFGLATAATSNMTLSNSLKPLTTMVSMALVLKDIPLENIVFVQYPGATEQGGIYYNKVAPIPEQADALFAKLAADEPFALASGTGRGSVADPDLPVPVVPGALEPNAPGAENPGVPGAESGVDPGVTMEGVDPSGVPAAPTGPEVLDGVLGQTAADQTCSKSNN